MTQFDMGIILAGLASESPSVACVPEIQVRTLKTLAWLPNQKGRGREVGVVPKDFA